MAHLRINGSDEETIATNETTAETALNASDGSGEEDSGSSRPTNGTILILLYYNYLYVCHRAARPLPRHFVLYQYPVEASLLQLSTICWPFIVNSTTNREFPCSSRWFNENIVANRSGPYKSVLCRVATWYTVEERANLCLSVVHSNN
jgi:hypothetical protein